MKQDPVLMFNSDEEQDLMLDESLNLFETSSLIDSGDSAIHLSLDDLASFAQPMVATDGSHTRYAQSTLKSEKSAIWGSRNCLP